MAYTRQLGIDFWFEFDNLFLWNPTPQSADALRRAYDFGNGGPEFDRPVDLLRTSYSSGTHPASFVSSLTPNRAGFVDLARLQMGVVTGHLPNRDDIRSAFEDFGQGVLFDDRRMDGWKVHKMDGSPEDWVGYQRWNAFARAIQLFGEQADDWLHLNRCIALAWAIQTEANPADDSRTNPGLPGARMDALRAVWMSTTAKTLDWAFTTHRYHAPTLEEITAQSTATVAATGYGRVQQILQTATPTGNPLHRQAGVSQGRFWLKPYDVFVNLSIYNHKLIADPGPDRGKNSALVQVLRGTLAGVPRMPRAPLPPVADADIQFISDWIDAGAPEA